MEAVYYACLAAKLTVPDEVTKFFGDENPEDNEDFNVDLTESFSVTSLDNDFTEGCEIDLKKIPKDVKILKVFTTV